MRQTATVRWSLRLAVLACAILLSGCVYSDSLRHDEFWPVRGLPGHAIVNPTVFYATDREAEAGSFNLHWGAALHCGRVSLFLSNTHGFQITQPAPAAQDCDDPATMTAFTDTVAAAARLQDCDRLLVIVHGYNTIFRNALLRGGQVALDTKWRCPILLFSWSSEGKFDRYVADIEHSGYAVPELTAMLRAAAAENLTLDILAHSMGSRITLNALGGLCRGQSRLAGELILAAPDVSAERSNDDFGHLLKRVAPCIGRTTIYASDNDMALIGSEGIHGGVPRAGRVPDQDEQYERSSYGNIDVVDAGFAPGDPAGHGYFALSYETVDDMAGAIAGLTLAQRAATGGTLGCFDMAGSVCADGGGRYQLFVTPERRPDWTSRLLRHLWPLILPVQ